MASPLLMMHFLLETFAQGLPARVPEPEMLMRDAAQVDAYAAQGRQHGFLAPLHLYHAIQASAFICPGDVVLDLACGPGNQLMQIARMNPAAQFIGIDASAEMLDQAQQLQACEAVDNLSFQRCLLPALEGVASHSVDAVICTMALHHLPDLAALAATFGEIKRVLKPGGCFYAVDFGRLKRVQTQRYLARQRKREWPEVFCVDYYNSLRAAFSAEELVGAARDVFGEQVELRQTHQVPLFVAVMSGPPMPVGATQQQLARAAYQVFDAKQRADFRDIARFFWQGGYPLAFAPWA